MMINVDGVKIKCIACCVPSTIEDNLSVPLFDLEKRERIVKITGVGKRRIVDENTCTSDLAINAARSVIDKMGIDVSEIGILVFATQTPDFILPATSHIIHKELRLKEDTITFDINLGCSAYIYGLYLVSTMLKTIQKKYALLLVGDTISKYSSPEDASTVFLFGDAGTATIVEKASVNDIMKFSLGADGNGWQNLLIPAGASRMRTNMHTHTIVTGEDGNARSEEHLFMDGMEIFNFTISTVVPHIQRVMESCGMPGIVVFHQANKYLLEFMRKSLGIARESFLYSLPEYGNTSSASIPLTLCTHKARVKEMSKTLLSGFGVGYSWGTVVLDLKDCFFNTVFEL